MQPTTSLSTGMFITLCSAESLSFARSFPWIAKCESSDLSCEHVHPSRVRPRPLRVIVFDRRQGATGLMAAAFGRMGELVVLARDVVRQCACAEGCLRCVFDLECSEHNVVIDKRAALVILQSICGRIRGSDASAM